MTPDLERSLADIGLERNESIVYTSLLKLKSATAGEIAKRTGMHRRSVYDTIDSLMRKGYATYIKRNDIRYYQTAGIERLRDEVRRKEDALQNVMGQLIAFQTKKIEHSVAVYEGAGGVRSVFRGLFDYIKEGEELIGFGDKGGMSSIMPDYISNVNELRLRKKIRIRRLVINRPGLTEKLRDSRWGRKFHEIRIMPEGFSSDMRVWVCGERTLVLFMREQLLGIFIESPEIAKGFKDQFEFFWNKGTIVDGFSRKGFRNGAAMKTTKKVQTSTIDVDKY